MFINGDLTMGENIGDMSGLEVAYEAYKMSLGGKPAPVIDGLTGDQRFFLAFAQAWRGNQRDDAIKTQVASDPHSPRRFRVIGPLRNLDAWYEAFKIGAGFQILHPAGETRPHLVAVPAGSVARLRFDERNVEEGGAWLNRRKCANRLIMRAVAAEVALVEVEGVDRERLADQGGVAREEGVERGRGPAAPAREGDVRVEGAALGRQAGTDADALDLGGERGERAARLDPGPQRAAARCSKRPTPAMRSSNRSERTVPSASARSSASGRSTSPMKRSVRCNCSSPDQRSRGRPPSCRAGGRGRRSGGRMATNRRCMARLSCLPRLATGFP